MFSQLSVDVKELLRYVLDPTPPHILPLLLPPLTLPLPLPRSDFPLFPIFISFDSVSLIRFKIFEIYIYF